ncbi:MAG: prepilin-type N-terminal cleavage/methylation domain-containing protein [Candidatus Omnitrophica bacterium]|nr:prepilin-type N-terminal cleavage/methylation domain-containing protein [Candidatus Omnitrophota bacterium]MCA9416068.1 prepilin-type N-terminal cleavage/methylation domain-containing protein [Candidatus Omnitrophota bacterium]MCA9424375.1 prepilin-type N-terminal cleavage/methylation domain-containing protein [Candidatus Omnitrophota bacterium]MCA9431938.1 prepilin-type N-terminal cleavage/methylation domain-containing protein [Candidatus Omnitrophota bacterium]MCA9434817.1 prepilin-type N-
MRRQRSHTGFTLVELLVVIAIILILISIALPNYMDALVRARSTQVYAELRSVSIALQSYYLDFNFYPLRTWNSSLPDWVPSGLNNLTTPVTYMDPARLPDPFTDGQYYTHYRYWPVRPNGYVQANNETATPTDSHWYLLSSNGPEARFTAFADAMRGQDDIPFSHSVYSPTNGTRSRGNIWKQGGLPDGVGRTIVRPVLPAPSR